MRDNPSIFELCERLHGSSKGTGDPLSKSERSIIRAHLSSRLENWKWEYRVSVEAYDEAVRNLIIAALLEDDLS